MEIHSLSAQLDGDFPKQTLLTHSQRSNERDVGRFGRPARCSGSSCFDDGTKRGSASRHLHFESVCSRLLQTAHFRSLSYTLMRKVCFLELLDKKWMVTTDTGQCLMQGPRSCTCAPLQNYTRKRRTSNARRPTLLKSRVVCFMGSVNSSVSDAKAVAPSVPYKLRCSLKLKGVKQHETGPSTASCTLNESVHAHHQIKSDIERQSQLV